MDVVTLLKGSYLFKNFDDREIELISTITKLKEYEPNEIIFHEGDEAAKMYFVLVGSVRIMKKGIEREIARIVPGDLFGELPFLDGGDRSAMAVALEKTELMQIPYSRFSSILLNSPETALKFYIEFAKHVSRRLRNTTGKLQKAEELLGRSI